MGTIDRCVWDSIRQGLRQIYIVSRDHCQDLESEVYWDVKFINEYGYCPVQFLVTIISEYQYK